MEEQSGEMHNETPRPGLYQCGFCKKNYARSDHLIRHVRSRMLLNIDSDMYELG